MYFSLPLSHFVPMFLYPIHAFRNICFQNNSVKNINVVETLTQIQTIWFITIT